MKLQNPLARLPGALNFFREVKVEGKRVNWPTREKTIKDTIVVIIFAIVVAAFLSIFDFVFQYILDLVISPSPVPIEAIPSDVVAPAPDALPADAEVEPDAVTPEGIPSVVPAENL